MRISRPVLRRFLLVAGLVTLAAGGVLTAVLAVSDTLFIRTTDADLDTQLSSEYTALVQRPPLLENQLLTGRQPNGVVLWRLDTNGDVTGTSGLAPPLPESYHRLQGRAAGVIEGIDYHLVGGPLPDGGWLVVGGDVEILLKPQQNVLQAQLVTVPPALLAVFLGALAVGRWVAGPIERARQQQLAFTANASHELRTPLAVLEGEVSLALSRPRSAAEYRQALDRVAEETAIVHGLVEDLLWLARFESEPRPPATEPVQLTRVASQAVGRFAGLAEDRGLELTLAAERPAVIEAPGPWMDRLLGVLLSNACRYTPGGGRVQVTVQAGSEGPCLLVDDSGPGVPQAERGRIFERFYRGTAHGDGAGLGLSIGDAIVRATGGLWEVTTSPLGGARFAVSWPAERNGLTARPRAWWPSRRRTAE